LGSPQAKRNVFEAISNTNIVYPKLIHPDVILSEETDIGIGCVVCAGSILTVNIRLEDFVSLNLRCTVGHDSTIGAFSSVMPGVSISGEVRIENEVYIGTGAGILNQIEIGSGTIVGAGAVVNRSLPAYCTAVGVPARIIQQRQPEEL
jgi:sugar O-acyltransferase (sialic acid O-acetyltransferase NeuD family)